MTPLKELQGVPRDNKAISLWTNEHAAFDHVVTEIAKVVDDLRRRKTAEPEFVEQASAVAIVALTPLSPRPEVSNLPDLAVFRDVDAPWCPEMVVIPAGSFLMGSPPVEEGWSEAEGPQHPVTFDNRFAIGRCAVTVGEYRKFIVETGRSAESGMRILSGNEWTHDGSKSWRNPGFMQTDRHPAVAVSWHHASAYCRWLSRETNKAYRLPSEAEWEYACRAGTTTPFSFGETITPSQVNYKTATRLLSAADGRCRESSGESLGIE